MEEGSEGDLVFPARGTSWMHLHWYKISLNWANGAHFRGTSLVSATKHCQNAQHEDVPWCLRRLQQPEHGGLAHTGAKWEESDRRTVTIQRWLQRSSALENQHQWNVTGHSESGIRKATPIFWEEFIRVFKSMHFVFDVHCLEKNLLTFY